MAFFENMSAIEKEELVIALATLICADAQVELTVGVLHWKCLVVEGEPGQACRCYW